MAGSSERDRIVLVGRKAEGEFGNCLALGYLKTFLDAQLDLSRRVEIILLEFSLNEKSPEVMAAEILMKSPRLVGFSCYTWDIDSYCAVAACLRASCPDIRIVF